jgi:hypothetical protein
VRGRHRNQAPYTSGSNDLQMPVVCLFAIGASLCIGFGDALTQGAYSVIPLVLVGAGVALAWTASSPGLRPFVLPERATYLLLMVALSISLFASTKYRGGLYGTGPAARISIVLVIVAALVALVFLIFRSPRLALAAAVPLIGAACVAMTIASPSPRIDVWYMYQAVARGLLHGHNVYTQHWVPHLAHQATIYAYFPGAAVVLTPFYALFHDVRFGVILALLLSAVLIGRMAPKPGAAIFGVLLLLFPYLTFGVEQAWSEPMTLTVLLLMVWAIKSGRRGWAIVALAVLLTFQQYDLIFVPLAAAWTEFGVKRTAVSVALATAFAAPWAIAAPHAFVQGAIKYELNYPFASMSLSVFHQLSIESSVLAYAVVLVCVGVALVVAMARVYKDGSFLMGCSVVFVTLDLVDKLSRFNEWELAAGVVLAAGAEALGSFRGQNAYVVREGASGSSSEPLRPVRGT